MFAVQKTLRQNKYAVTLWPYSPYSSALTDRRCRSRLEKFVQLPV